MQNHTPIVVGGGDHPHVRNIAIDIILTLITCGLFNLFIQYKQMQAVNTMIGQPKYSFLPWFLLTFITCGLYHLYHEYRMSDDVSRALRKPDSNDALVALIFSAIGFSIVVDAIQQSEINKFYGSTAL